MSAIPASSVPRHNSRGTNGPSLKTPDELYRELKGPLLSYLLAEGASFPDATDVVHDVIVQAIRLQRSRLHIIYHRAYYKRVAKHEWLRRLDLKERRDHDYDGWRVNVTPDVLESVMEPAKAAEDVVLQALTNQELTAALALLPRAQQTAIQLRMDGHSYKSIAGLMGTTVRGVEGYLHRARARLHGVLDSLELEQDASTRAKQHAPKHGGDRPPVDGPVAELRAQLLDLQARRRMPSVREIARRSGDRVSGPTVSRALRCQPFPRWRVVEAIAQALEAEQNEVKALQELYTRCKTVKTPRAA